MYSQAVHNGPALPLLALALPLVHLEEEFEEGALGGGDVSVARPAQVLELTHHQVPLLGLEHNAHAGYDVWWTGEWDSTHIIDERPLINTHKHALISTIDDAIICRLHQRLVIEY